ncbi:hypothetical protein Ddye_013913 [Dipteronia dyeriana]|uniref:HAT C-terminal dimerisation domain-containing protein n=1 Tax=Dipteronia dyeriana TaxID=168575 RepID=A0AAE0CK16_9ROSI|nr:hypothetical protein Ddye_013913 [Dipteronia dyeriana]
MVPQSHVGLNHLFYITSISEMRNPSTTDGFFKRIKTSEAGSSSSKSNINILPYENQSMESPTKDINQDNKSLLTSVVNIVSASCKRNDEFKHAQATAIAHLITIDELKSGTGLNQISTLQRAGDTRWCSHYKLIQQLRDTEWDKLFANLCSFCEAHNIDVPKMNARYVAGRGQARQQQENYTIEQYYWVDLFYAAIDSQLQELNNRFSEQAIELLILSTTLEPREGYESFRIDDICKLVNKFYPHDFADHEKLQLKIQLQHYEYNVVQHSEFKSLLNLSSLCQCIIVLVLTLPVSTATTERLFPAKRIVKTRLCNKMDDDFFTNSLIMYIEREIAEKLNIYSIIDDFRDPKERRVPF